MFGSCTYTRRILTPLCAVHSSRNQATTKEVRKAKKSYERSTAEETMRNPEDFWKYVRSKTKPAGIKYRIFCEEMILTHMQMVTRQIFSTPYLQVYS